MAGRGAEIAARARALVGVRFRSQGRDPQTGLDCVGLAAIAAEVPPERVPRDYTLRGEHLAAIEATLDRAGFQRRDGLQAGAGDVAVMKVGPAQLHLAVLIDNGFVHADARLRRVVERPAPLPWPMLSVWRANEDFKWPRSY